MFNLQLLIANIRFLPLNMNQKLGIKKSYLIVSGKSNYSIKSQEPIVHPSGYSQCDQVGNFDLIAKVGFVKLYFSVPVS